MEERCNCKQKKTKANLTRIDGILNCVDLFDRKSEAVVGFIALIYREDDEVADSDCVSPRRPSMAELYAKSVTTGLYITSNWGYSENLQRRDRGFDEKLKWSPVNQRAWRKD